MTSESHSSPWSASQSSTPGYRFLKGFDGDQHVVEALSGTSIPARLNRGKTTLCHAASLFTMKGFSIQDSDSDSIQEFPLLAIPDPALDEAKVLAKHALRLTTPGRPL